jgi:hypothetical protein
MTEELPMATRTITEGVTIARRRRLSETYIGEWIMTTDHKKIGVMYIVTAFFFFLVGGVDAMLIRTQLAVPNGKVLSPEVYNQVFTMHAVTMIFLFVMPMLSGLGNYVVPLMIGARDMAFPRMNAFGYWVILFGGVFLTSSFLFGAAPNAGWFAYAPLTELSGPGTTSCGNAVMCTPGPNMDFWALGILMLGISSIAASINFVVTILKLRAPGMTINRMPLFTWMTLITAFLLLFALPSVTMASILILLDRHLGTHFYQAGFGGDPLLWQHLFWHHLGGVTGLRAQTNFWLHLHCLVWGCYWLPEFYGVGAPHVCGWFATCCAGIFCNQHYTHSDSNGGEDIQLVWHDLRWQTQFQAPNAFCFGLYCHVFDWRSEWRSAGDCPL